MLRKVERNTKQISICFYFRDKDKFAIFIAMLRKNKKSACLEARSIHDPFTNERGPACPFGLLRVDYKRYNFFHYFASISSKICLKSCRIKKKALDLQPKIWRFSDKVSESNDNRTRRHPVDLLAGHLFYRQYEQSKATAILKLNHGDRLFFLKVL